MILHVVIKIKPELPNSCFGKHLEKKKRKKIEYVNDVIFGSLRFACSIVIFYIQNIYMNTWTVGSDEVCYLGCMKKMVEVREFNVIQITIQLYEQLYGIIKD